MGESSSLIDLKALSEPVVKLIECVSNAIGVVYEPTRIRRNSRAESDAALLKARTDGVISDIEYRTLSRLLEKELRRQSNIETIIADAASLLPDSQTTPDKPDEDWIADFFDLCQNCSSEQMRSLWSRLLAGEVDRPGSFSRRTMHAVKLLSTADANLFSIVCGCIWKISEESAGESYALIMDSDSNGRYSDATWGFDGSLLPRLEVLDLCAYQYFDLDAKRRYHLEFDGRKHTVSPPSENERLEIVTLSPVGSELFSVSGRSPNLEYYEITVEYLRNRSLIEHNG